MFSKCWKFYHQHICPVWWHVFKKKKTKTVGIPMGTNCATLHDDLFLFSYEVDLIADLIRKKELRLGSSFNLRIRYIDDVLTLNNPSFGDLIHRIYRKELAINYTTDTVKSTCT